MLRWFLTIALVWGTVSYTAEAQESSDSDALQVMLVTGGCCHDYEFQTKAMQLASKEAGLSVEWTVVNRVGS